MLMLLLIEGACGSDGVGLAHLRDKYLDLRNNPTGPRLVAELNFAESRSTGKGKGDRSTATAAFSADPKVSYS